MAEQKVEALHLLKLTSSLGSWRTCSPPPWYFFTRLMGGWGEQPGVAPIGEPALTALRKGCLVEGIHLHTEDHPFDVVYALVKVTGPELASLFHMPTEYGNVRRATTTDDEGNYVFEDFGTFTVDMASVAEAAPYLTTDGTVQALMNLIQSIRQALKI